MLFGIVVFPGSNCDRDCQVAIESVLKEKTVFIWHQEKTLPSVDLLILPGGFSYGDYLRTGAIASHSPIMKAVIAYANAGGKVLGICNGFQILTESGLLPGALLRNRKLKFICKNVSIRVDNRDTFLTSSIKDREVLTLPIAHAEGNYYVEPAVLSTMKRKNQIVFSYCDANGVVADDANPNGSIDSIAGICNEAGNVLGMMPHPERVTDPLLGVTDGVRLFQSLQSIKDKVI
ncbi:MAG: phosphoribosylformylglycinamidine synthase subunit PurQ [Nitrospirota bacterium]